MNPTSDTDPSPAAENPGRQPGFPSPAPANWREALLDLFGSRIALIEVEGKEAITDAVRRGILLTLLLLCLCFMWALLLAAAIAAISHSSGWPWYWIALGFSAIHLVTAIVLGRAAQVPAKPAFPITRSEFQKDRAWIESLQQTPKSNS